MKEKPTITLAIANERFKSEFAGYLRLLRSKYPVPAYLVEGVLTSALADIRKEVSEAATDDSFLYTRSLEEYYKEDEDAKRYADVRSGDDDIVDSDVCQDQEA